MFDVNPLSHRHYLAEIERVARRRPAPSGRRTDLAARAVGEMRRLLRSLRMREARRA